MRNLKKHLEKIYRKVALKLVKQGAGPPPPAAAQEENPVSQEAFHISGMYLSSHEDQQLQCREATSGSCMSVKDA